MARAKRETGVYPVIKVVAAAIAICEKDGKYTKTCEDNSTKDQFLAMDWFGHDDMAHTAKAQTVIDWAKDMPATQNDYMLNMGMALAGETMTPKQLGVALSAPAAYDRAMENAAKRAADAEKHAASEWVGAVGGRSTYDVEIVGKRFHTSFGSTMTKAVDGEGNVMSWWTDTGLDVGDKVTIKATVKAHREYNGVHETNVNRVAIAA